MNLELVGGLLAVDGETDQSGGRVDVAANQQSGRHALA